MRSRYILSIRLVAFTACAVSCSASNEDISGGDSTASGGTRSTARGSLAPLKGGAAGNSSLTFAAPLVGGSDAVGNAVAGARNEARTSDPSRSASGGAGGKSPPVGGSSGTPSGSTSAVVARAGSTSGNGGATNKGGSFAIGGNNVGKGGATVVGGAVNAKGGATVAGGGVQAKGGSTAVGGAEPTSSSNVAGAANTGDACLSEYTWPPYTPTVAYDYQDEFGEIAKPTKDSSDVTGIAGRYTKDWWTFVYGNNKNSLVTESAWVPMLERFNTDFAYITDVMRWPRDGRARKGFYSAIYLYGSGLSSDTASNTATGGWQGTAGDGPMVLASYYPVYSFDPACTYADKVAQQGAMIHEGIHCILSTMPGCQKSCWFNEAGNTWLQANMEVKRTGKNPTAMGHLSAAAAVAPFMPIECYSGWLQDGSFGGPCAQNVERTNSNGQKISTWRNLLGGTQYGEAFAHALGVILGDKAMAWLFRYATKSGRVLQDLAEVTTPSPGIGPNQTRRLIQEYRARQAFGDFGPWQTAYKSLLTSEWNTRIEEERVEAGILQDVEPWLATPYVKTTLSGSTLTPEERTLPGWSGANQIPLQLSAGATCATVTFNPSGANMSCQLVYQDSTGRSHYGNPVSSGACSVPVGDVKNSVVVAVLANTDYIFDGGTKKYGYTLSIGSGISGTADINKKWYQ